MRKSYKGLLTAVTILGSAPVMTACLHSGPIIPNLPRRPSPLTTGTGSEWLLSAIPTGGSGRKCPKTLTPEQQQQLIEEISKISETGMNEFSDGVRNLIQFSKPDYFRTTFFQEGQLNELYKKFFGRSLQKDWSRAYNHDFFHKNFPLEDPTARDPEIDCEEDPCVGNGRNMIISLRQAFTSIGQLWNELNNPAPLLPQLGDNPRYNIQDNRTSIDRILQAFAKYRKSKEKWHDNSCKPLSKNQQDFEETAMKGMLSLYARDFRHNMALVMRGLVAHSMITAESGGILVDTLAVWTKAADRVYSQSEQLDNIFKGAQLDSSDYEKFLSDEVQPMRLILRSINMATKDILPIDFQANPDRARAAMKRYFQTLHQELPHYIDLGARLWNNPDTLPPGVEDDFTDTIGYVESVEKGLSRQTFAHYGLPQVAPVRPSSGALPVGKPLNIPPGMLELLRQAFPSATSGNAVPMGVPAPAH